MNHYEVRITDAALTDMEKIYEYIANVLLVPEIAMEQYNRISNAIISLEFFPKRYSLFEMEPEHSLGIRKMVVDNYIICYIVTQSTVNVTDVLYGASNMHAQLGDRHK